MKKIFIAAVIVLMAVAACETPQPATANPSSDSTGVNRTDTTGTTSRPDSTMQH